METGKTSETPRSIARSSLYGLTTWILPLGLSFVGTPIILKNLGVKEYGIYSLVIGFVSYSFYFNFGRAITKYIAQYRISGENDKIKDVISATLFINIIVGILGVAIIYGVGDWLVVNFFQIEAADQRKTVISLYLAALVVFFMLLGQVFNSVLQGIHRFDAFSNIFNLNSLVMVSGNIFIVLSGYGLLSLLVWNVIITFLTFILAAFVSKKLLPEFDINFKVNYGVFKLVMTYSAGIIGYQFLQNMLTLFERGWITGKLGSENLTYYTVPMQLSIYIHAFISSIMLVIFPLASELTNDKEKLLRLYLKASKIVCLLVVFFAASLIIEGKIFLTLWINADFAEKTYLILCIHVITFSLVAIQIISWNLVEGLGYPSYNLFIFVICLIINVLLIFLLTSDYGNVGVAIGRLGGFGVTFFSVFYVEKWIFGKLQFKFWLRIVGILSVSAIFGALAEKFIISRFNISWITLISASLIGGIVYCLFIWMLGLISEDEKILFKNLFRRQNV